MASKKKLKKRIKKLEKRLDSIPFTKRVDVRGLTDKSADTKLI